MSWLHGTIAVFQKDIRLELRSRFALNALGLFIAASILIVRFALGNADISPETQSALLWIVILFAAVVGLGRAFVMEQERGTALLLKLTLPPTPIYIGKLTFNIALTLVLNLAAMLVFWVLLSPTVYTWSMLFLALILGAIGLAAALTLLSAIIAHTASSGPLLAVLSFPILIPLLFSVVEITQEALSPTSTWSSVSSDMVALFGYAGLMITASILLFDYVWND